MRTLALTFRLADDHHEALIAELADLGFDAFESDDDRLIAYGPAAEWDDVSRDAVTAWLYARGLDDAEVEETLVEPENWNARWEATMQPVVAGRFVVAPTWAALPPEAEGRRVLRIDPKMSFGTGYHESTRLALGLLPRVVHPGARVLDVGTGTGILALAALALGADHALGCDIDPWSVVNAEENAGLNGFTDRFEVREGSLEVVPEDGFDLVCANIHLNVLVALLPGLKAKRVPGGFLLLAGLLRTDQPAMEAALTRAGLAVQAEDVEGEWWACVAA